MKAALGSDAYDTLPSSSSTYGKWFTGKRNPESGIWDAIASNTSQENLFQEEVAKNLNTSVLPLVASRFGISVPKDECIDKDAFSLAVTKQFYALAQGNGEAENIVPKIYRPQLMLFPVYAQKASDKFSKIETPFTDSEERFLDEIYVCNKLINRQSSFVGRTRGPLRVIENVTLDSIRGYSSKVILVANCGMGKSMMLQHLFMESIARHNETGELPVFVELRQFGFTKNPLNPLLQYIVDAVKRFDDSFTEGKAVKLLENGQCKLLLDGIDEIDPSDENDFEVALTKFVDRYPKNQYVLASRECKMLKVATGFAKLYLQPFDENQAKTLINNLLNLPEEETIREEVNRYLSEAFLKKHTIFATNPMLLTFIVMKHPIIESFSGKQSLFYKAIYTTILSGHDKSKIAYDRFFHSVQNADEFTNVFREFCMITYMDKIHEFDQFQFEEYFNKLKAKETIENPHAMTKDAFIHDTCATACMMFEQAAKILYIDSGFQEYLCANYLFQDSEDKVKKLGLTLWTQAEELFDGSAAFDMFYEMSPSKAEKCFFLPYLREIFHGRDDDSAFLNFLKLGYQTLDYNVIDMSLVRGIMAKLSLSWVPLKSPILEPANIIQSMIFKVIDINKSLSFSGLFEAKTNYAEFHISTYVGEKYYNTNEQKDCFTGRRVLGDLKSFEEANDMERFITQNGKLLLLGYECKADFAVLAVFPNKYQDLINILKAELWPSFETVKDYYVLLSQKYKVEQ